MIKYAVIMRNALKRRGRRDFREVERMGGAYSASLCRGGITGGCLTIQPGGLLFTTQKIQVPRDKSDVGRSRVLGFPAVQLETEAQGWEFVIFRRAAFLRELRSCWLGREISF